MNVMTRSIKMLALVAACGGRQSGNSAQESVMQIQPSNPTSASRTSRRSFALGLGGLLASVMVDPATAKRVSPKSRIQSVKQRVKINVNICESMGGAATVEVRPGGTSVSCEGGFDDGSTCVHSTKRTRCYTAHQELPGMVVPYPEMVSRIRKR
jgi:hypothetical protein